MESLLGPLLLSATALLIAFVGYPWQKARDRRLSVEAEKRKAYSEFLEAYYEFEDYAWGWNKTDKLYALTPRKKLGNLYLYAPISVIKCCERASESLFEVGLFSNGPDGYEKWSIASDFSVAVKEMTEQRQMMLRAIREDLLKQPVSQKDVQDQFAEDLFGQEGRLRKVSS